MEQVLLVVQVIIAMGLIGMVLIQRSDSDGFGLSGGSGSNLLSGRGSANLMTRTTAILAALFIINSLALAVLAAHGHKSSITDTIEEQQAGEGNVVPAVPLAGAEKSEKKTDAKADEKTVPVVPAADAEKKSAEADNAATEEKPAAKKPAKKPAVKPADADPDASESDHNE